MEVLSEEILKKIKYIQFRTNHLINDVMAGEYESAFKGRGMEFEEVREYKPGDDIRSCVRRPVPQRMPAAVHPEARRRSRGNVD